MSKKLALLVTTLGLTAVLTACSGSSSSSTPDGTDAPSADRTVSPTSECTEPGSVSDAIDVTGDFGVEPAVTMEAPITTTATERTVAIAGTGTEKTKAGSVVNVSFSAYDGATGDKVDSTGYGAESTPVSLTVADNYVPGLVRAVNCSVVGDRVVAVMPPSDGFGDKGWSDLGLAATDSMIFVIDINSIQPAKATGVDQPVQDGLPAVTLAENGAPTIAIPDTEAPGELTIAALKKGDGAVVADGDTAQIEYTGVLWATGDEFDSSWKTDGPAALPTAGVVPGFAAALVGQTVGSQVLAIIPPADGYGADGQPDAGISGTDTLVFVIDILGTGPTAAAPAQ